MAQQPPEPTLSPLPAPPGIRVVVAHDRSSEARAIGGFLNVRRLDLELEYPQGRTSDRFSYDVGARALLDAVIIAAHFSSGGTRRVYLRSAVRPPCALRPLPPAHDGSLWELPAGLIDPGEEPVDAAVRELGEELGFVVSAADLHPLGPPTFPAPGMIGERHLYFAVAVDPLLRATPTEDGSALERFAAILALPLADAIEHCRRGAIPDAKTELGLRRLAEAL